MNDRSIRTVQHQTKRKGFNVTTHHQYTRAANYTEDRQRFQKCVNYNVMLSYENRGSGSQCEHRICVT